MNHCVAIGAYRDKIIGFIMLAAVQFGDGDGQVALQKIAGYRLVNLRQV